MRTFLALLIVALLCAASCSRGASGYVERGNSLFAKARYDEAALQYRKALQKDPNYGEAYYRLGLVQIEKNEGVAARESLTRAVSLMPDFDAAKLKLAEISLAIYLVDPKHPKLLYDEVDSIATQFLAKDHDSFDGLRLRGSVRLLDRKPAEAIEYFERARRVKPMDQSLILSLTEALLETNRTQEAEQLAQELIRAHPDFGPIYDVLYARYSATGRVDAAEEILKLRVRNNPAQAGYRLELAEHYSRRDRTAEMDSTLRGLLDDPKAFPAARLQVGDFYARNGRWEQALRQFENGSRSDPKEKLLYQKRILSVYLAQGQKIEAWQTVEAILKDHPDDKDSRVARANLLLEKGDAASIDSSLREFESLVKQAPDEATLRFSLGRANLLRGSLDAARTQLQEGLRLRGDDLTGTYLMAIVSLRQQKPAEALRYSDAILARDHEDQQGRLLRAVALTDGGSYQEARAELNRILKSDPRNREAQLQLGFLSIAQKDFQKASEIFGDLYRPGQSDLRPAAALAQVYVSNNQIEKAVQLLDQELDKSPDSIAVHELVAELAVRGRKYDRAIQEYRYLISKNPSAADYKLRLGNTLAQKGDTEGAVTVLQGAADNSPKNPLAALALAAALEKTGKMQAAKAEYRRALALRPDDPIALNNLAFAMVETGESLDEALQLVQRALQRSPGQPNFTDTLGWIYLKKQMNASASQVFEKLIRQDPANPTFHYHFGMALIASGDPEQARNEFQRALENRPDPELERRLRAQLGSL